MTKIIRVFPRRTKGTPVDDLVRIGCSPGLFDDCDVVHISVSFTWDIPAAELLEKQWRHVAPVIIDGPALGNAGSDFQPGLYLKNGYTITTRGCPNKCWFCDVWRREGNIRELEIKQGWNILDSNILSASKNHFGNVINMLRNQKNRAEFTGGLDSRLLTDWHAKLLKSIKPESLFFAYDTPDDRDPLFVAGEILNKAGFKKRKGGRPARALRAYVLIGFKKDTFDKAQNRLADTIKAGFLPMAMLYRPPDPEFEPDPEWKKFQRQWARPANMARFFRSENQ